MEMSSCFLYFFVDRLPASSQLIRIIPKLRNQVGALTTLRDELFVVRWHSRTAEVYDVNTMLQKGTLQLLGLRGNACRGLVACGVNQCIYVSDFDFNIVHKVELTGKYAASEWRVKCYPCGLSINPSHNLLVAGWGSHALYEYTARGTLVRQIDLPSSMKPQHGLWYQQLAENKLIVTYSDDKGLSHGCSVVDTGGRIVRSYGGPRGSQHGQMDFPRGIAVNKYGTVFVADSDNNRIVVLNISTFAADELAVCLDGGLLEPVCLSIDESCDRLYIGERKGGRIIVVDNVRDLVVS